jgi:hypothetical protein
MSERRKHHGDLLRVWQVCDQLARAIDHKEV